MLDLRWNNLTSSVENELLVCLKQNQKLLDLRLKGNRFSEKLFNGVSVHLQKTCDSATNYAKENFSRLKREVEQASLVSDTAKSGRK